MIHSDGRFGGPIWNSGLLRGGCNPPCNEEELCAADGQCVAGTQPVSNEEGSSSEENADLRMANRLHTIFRLGAGGFLQAFALQPLELLEKLAALIPRPYVNLIVYHGVLAPNAHRSLRRQGSSRRRPV